MKFFTFNSQKKSKILKIEKKVEKNGSKTNSFHYVYNSNTSI